MLKKPLKVVIRGKDEPMLREVKGYFTWLNDLRVFIYYDSDFRLWHVIDLETGQAFANGESMALAKSDAFKLMNKFKDLKEKDHYKQARFLYQRLLKAGT